MKCSFTVSSTRVNGWRGFSVDMQRTESDIVMSTPFGIDESLWGHHHRNKGSARGQMICVWDESGCISKLLSQLQQSWISLSVLFQNQFTSCHLRRFSGNMPRSVFALKSFLVSLSSIIAWTNCNKLRKARLSFPPIDTYSIALIRLKTGVWCSPELKTRKWSWSRVVSYTEIDAERDAAGIATKKETSWVCSLSCSIL